MSSDTERPIGKIIQRVGFSYALYEPFDDRREGIYYANTMRKIYSVDIHGWLFLALSVPGDQENLSFVLARASNGSQESISRIFHNQDNYNDVYVHYTTFQNKKGVAQGNFTDSYSCVIKMTNVFRDSTRRKTVYAFVRISDPTIVAPITEPYVLSVFAGGQDRVLLYVSPESAEQSDDTASLALMSKFDLISHIAASLSVLSRDELSRLAQSVNEARRKHVNPYRFPVNTTDYFDAKTGENISMINEGRFAQLFNNSKNTLRAELAYRQDALKEAIQDNPNVLRSPYHIEQGVLGKTR